MHRPKEFVMILALYSPLLAEVTRRVMRAVMQAACRRCFQKLGIPEHVFGALHLLCGCLLIYFNFVLIMTDKHTAGRKAVTKQAQDGPSSGLHNVGLVPRTQLLSAAVDSFKQLI